MLSWISNIWPIHIIAWAAFSGVGLIVGYFLANATERVWLNALIFFGILLSMAFAFAQTLAMILQIGPEDVSSFSQFGAFWLRFNEGQWFVAIGAREVWESTAIGCILCFMCGIMMLVSNRNRR